MENWAIFLLTNSSSPIFTDISNINNNSNNKNNENSILNSVPKALWPVNGVPVIDLWLSKISQQQATSIISCKDIFILTNQRFHSKFTEWGQSRSIPYQNILISDAASSELTSLQAIIHNYESITNGKNLLVINVDSIINCDLSLISLFDQSTDKGGVFLSSSSCGISENLPANILVNDQNHLISETSTDIFNSHLIPVFTIPSCSLISLKTISDAVATTIPDMLRYITREFQIQYQAIPVTHYFPLNSIEFYNHAISYFENFYRETYSHLPSHVNIICPARAGLIGNPSDGFHGKTLSFIVNNFYAQVTITANPTLDVQLIPHPVFDITHFQSFDSLHKETQLNGYYGGLRLLKATCRSFARRCCRLGLIIHLQRGFTISYDTTIPRRVGLSGSSAIIVATYKGLMEFFGLTLHDLKLELYEFPQVILDIEREELGIVAGLQDRVIQTYGGIVHMDFTQMGTQSCGVYTPLDPSLLPELYLLYNVEEGGDSGKVHSTAKTRWLNGDPLIIAGMKELGHLADQAKECLIQRDYITLATLMNKNFQLRRELYGDEVVGKKNISIATLANQLGLACKFTGSGGAFVCLTKNGHGWLSNDEESRMREEFQKEGFEFVRIEKLV